MWPIGQLSDRMERRLLRMVLSGAAVLLLLIAVAVGEGEARAVAGQQGLAVQMIVFVIILLIGGSMYPMYSVASGLAFDRADGRPMIEISKTILAVNSLGAIAGPFAIPLLGAVVGDGLALPTGLLLACALNLVVAAMSRRAPVRASEQTPAVASIPPTSVEMVQAAAEVVEEDTETTDPAGEAAPQSGWRAGTGKPDDG